MRASRWCLLLLSALALVGLCAVRQVKAGVTNEPPQKLQVDYYRNSCRDVESLVRQQVESSWKQEASLAPKLIRLLYGDCFIKGCDASILLDGPSSEKTAPQNAAILGFTLDVIDKIKQVLEERCPGVVSCADIINFAARDAVHLAGGLSYPVLAGRRDGMSSTAASVDLPVWAPWKTVVAYFEARGLNEEDLTTLLGGHTMGQTSCSFISDRLYNFNKTGKPDPSMDPSFLAQMRTQCPPNSTNRVYLDPDSGSSYKFSNSFYARILNHQAVLGVDQHIASNPISSKLARTFAADINEFHKRFGQSMVQMGNNKVLTGNEGEIRKNCRVVNGK